MGDSEVKAADTFKMVVTVQAAFIFEAIFILTALVIFKAIFTFKEVFTFKGAITFNVAFTIKAVFIFRAIFLYTALFTGCSCMFFFHVAFTCSACIFFFMCEQILQTTRDTTNVSRLLLDDNDLFAPVWPGEGIYVAILCFARFVLPSWKALCATMNTLFNLIPAATTNDNVTDARIRGMFMDSVTYGPSISGMYPFMLSPYSSPWPRLRLTAWRLQGPDRARAGGQRRDRDQPTLVLGPRARSSHPVHLPQTSLPGLTLVVCVVVDIGSMHTPTPWRVHVVCVPDVDAVGPLMMLLDTTGSIVHRLATMSGHSHLTNGMNLRSYLFHGRAEAHSPPDRAHDHDHERV
ncbi:hypothetical protein Z517_09266 [Fonsecaea pedrosoi CBS 271.37]|uniref:Unplaced genomic scaffold supercont1.6, whole genome shotgun sequence n=1 Tax=Fonsecaea pedrosoi CBS 271.37 TaxID=1442368 RepID=A0A0D2ERD9_9EURO|nr:uncharacterized protein Z517_09266 [Fonsecaea pedrosoi CBS 271.37]KIW76822.1 hypothetical protein Z517_09266 [Fonsecaea pedrosoi CBS 271.37]